MENTEKLQHLRLAKDTCGALRTLVHKLYNEKKHHLEADDPYLHDPEKVAVRLCDTSMYSIPSPPPLT
jgi:hypothetical protein